MQADRDIRPLSESEAEVYVASVCFKTGPPGAAGVEVERLVHDVVDPRMPVAVARVKEATAASVGRLPGGGVISFEPGGQLEVSSACAPNLPALMEATRADLATVGTRLADAGLCFGSVALDPDRPAVRSLEHPRYVSMERHFNSFGSDGRTMMCSTASLQVSLDAGSDAPGPTGAAQRWSRLHTLLPVLIAMFANSPFVHGMPSGWRSNRQRTWLAIDATRTAAVPSSAGLGALRPRRPGAVHPFTGILVGRAAGAEDAGLAPWRGSPARNPPGSGLPPDHAFSAGQATRLHGTPGHRCPGRP